MRDPDRIDKILEEVKRVWEKYPDLRLGQLLLNIPISGDIYYIEDEQLIRELKKLYLGE